MAFLQELLLEDKSHCLLPVGGNEGGGGLRAITLVVFRGTERKPVVANRV